MTKTLSEVMNLRVIYPHHCSQCGSRNIEDDAHFLYHMKSHGIRNLYSHWDKKENK